MPYIKIKSNNHRILKSTVNNVDKYKIQVCINFFIFKIWFDFREDWIFYIFEPQFNTIAETQKFIDHKIEKYNNRNKKLKWTLIKK